MHGRVSPHRLIESGHLVKSRAVQYRWGIGLLLFAAAAVRFAQLGKLELWLDEAYSAVAATSPAGVWRESLNDTNPPLYFWLLKLWIHGFGLSEAGVRSLSAVASIAQLAAMGLWLRSLCLSRRAVAWAVAVGALAPLHIYYAQEARAYALATLFVTLTLWAYTRAAGRGRWADWALYGAAHLAALYTHAAALFLMPALWLAGPLLGLRRKGWGRMLAVQAGVGALYLPWLGRSLATLSQWGGSWIESSWSWREVPFLIPRSLEVLGIGGRLPEYIRFGSPPAAVAVLWSFFLFAILAFALSPLAAHSMESDGRWLPLPIGRRALDRRAVLLLIFLFAPLLAVLLYSMVRRPIYVVGRYDVLVYPAYLGLLGVGLGRMQGYAGKYVRPSLAWAPAAAAILILASFALPPRYQPLPKDVMHHPQEMRGRLLAQYARPDDLVVCLGLEGAKIAYQMRRQGIDAEMMTFPLSTREHMGWFHHRNAASQPGALERDARTIMNAFAPPSPRCQRLWLVMDPYSLRPSSPGTMEYDYKSISAVLIDALNREGFHRSDSPGLAEGTQNLGIILLYPPTAAP